MTLKRVIPVVLIKDGLLVRSQLFKFHQAIGDPIPTIKRLSDWNTDEIMLINIGNSNKMDSRRDDKFHNLGKSDFSGLVKERNRIQDDTAKLSGSIQGKEKNIPVFQKRRDEAKARRDKLEKDLKIEQIR